MTALVLFAVLAGSPDGGPPFPRIANCYGGLLGGQRSERERTDAARFGLLIGAGWWNWSDPANRPKAATVLAEAHRRNPRLLALEFSSSAPYADPRDRTFPADGWLLQPDGRHIAGWPGTDMINLTKPAVLAWLVAKSVASVRERGHDGTFIDCMGNGFDRWACNIATRQPYQVDADGDGRADEPAWLDATWTSAKTELARQVREAIGPTTPFMANQAGEWGLPYLNGILLEDYLDYVLDGTGTMTWDRCLRDYLLWCAKGRQPNLTTIVSSSGLEPPFEAWRTMAQPDREALLARGRQLTSRMRFGLTTALMGDGYFAYDLHTRWRGQPWWYPEYDAPLGFPTGPAAAQRDGSWRREFDGGSVVVNPTLFDVVVTFDRPRRDISSGKVSRTLVIPAQDGRLLLPTDAAEAPGTLPDPQPLFRLEGPEPVVVRGDRLLLRGAGVAALLDAQGRLRSLLADGREVAAGGQTFMVTEPWVDYAYDEARHELAAGGVVFSGVRRFGDTRVRYRSSYRFEGRALVGEFAWTALTAARWRLFRQQLDLPVALYGGGRATADGAALELPVDRAPQPSLAGGARTVQATPPTGPALTVSASGALQLADERHYGVSAYRLGQHPAPREAAAGTEWRTSWRIEVGH